MNEPFFTTEADEMSRAFDPTNTDAPVQSRPMTPADLANPPEIDPGDAALPDPAEMQRGTPIRRAVTQHSVCPFCGTVNDGAAKSCRHCAMENTQATRTATRSKIGPWYVWQSRNPAAPGMNWATLMALLEKGRITTRSVVRGPTTGQLWRFAARVKGLSREFGICWHCGGELQKTARLCGSCKRLQQPPANPDVLLETADAAQVPQRFPMRDPKEGGLLSLIPEPVRKEVSQRPAAPDSPLPAMADGSSASATGEPHLRQPPALSPEALLDGSMPVIDMGQDAMPSNMEMRAFQFPADFGRHERPTSSVFRRVVVAGVMGILTLAGGLYFNPQVRPFYENVFHSLMNRVHGANGQTAPTPAKDPEAPRGPASYAPDETNAQARTSPTPLMGLTQERQTAAAPKTEITLAPGNGSESSNIALPKPAPAKPTASTLPDTSIVKVTPPSSDPQAAERRAWDLYERAIKSEQRSDYAAAVKEYQWIEQLRLPDGVGPIDVESRLQRAQQHANAKN